MLLEVACIITQGPKLEVVAESETYVVRHSPEDLKNMSDWSCAQFGWDKHTLTATPGNLAEKCLSSPTTVEEVDVALAQFVAAHCVKGGAVLAGNSVHCDKRFLDRYCPTFMSWLHYRIVDVSSFKEVVRRFDPGRFRQLKKPPPPHRALEDIKGSIAELRWYLENCLKKPLNL